MLCEVRRVPGQSCDCLGDCLVSVVRDFLDHFVDRLGVSVVESDEVSVWVGGFSFRWFERLGGEVSEVCGDIHSRF